MSLFLVSYDLKAPSRDYESLYTTLKTATSWWHYLESTWILYTSESLSSWNDKLHAVMDDNDNLFIVDITGQSRNGWLSKKAWEWLRTHGSS